MFPFDGTAFSKNIKYLCVPCCYVTRVVSGSIENEHVRSTLIYHFRRDSDGYSFEVETYFDN